MRNITWPTLGERGRIGLTACPASLRAMQDERRSPRCEAPGKRAEVTPALTLTSLLLNHVTPSLICLVMVTSLSGCDGRSTNKEADSTPRAASTVRESNHEAAKENERGDVISHEVIQIADLSAKVIHCEFIDHAEAAYLLGFPIRLTYVLGFRTPQPLQMDFMGNPRALVFTLYNSQGTQVEPSHKGHPDGMPAIYHCKVLSSFKVKLLVDVAKLFPIDSPGVYTLQVATIRNERVASASFEVAEFRENRHVVVRPYLEPTQQVPKTPGPSYRIATGTGNGIENSTPGFLTIEQIEGTEPERIYLPKCAFFIPQGAKVVKADLDCLDRIWWILESKGKQTLEVYDVRNGCRKTLVPWTTDKLILDATTARFGFFGKLIVGGPDNGVFFSTHTIGE